MAAYFNLTLDISPPTIQVAHPRFAIRYQTGVSVVVYGDELMMQEELYVIDSEGNRIDLIFDNEGDTLIGYYNFGECALGLATIHVSVRDYLDNVSPVNVSTINVLSEGEGNVLKLKQHFKVRKQLLTYKSRKIETKILARKQQLAYKIRKLDSHFKVRRMVVNYE